MVKLIVSLLFTILLNHLCERGMGVISWIIVFLPFILMSLIVAMLLVVLGLNPTTGKMEEKKKSVDENEKQKQIQNYNMKLHN